MTQTRIYTTSDEPSALALLKVSEEAFEDEAYPISAAEEPGQTGSWTVSIYVEAETVETVMEKMTKLANNANIAIDLQTETLPEIDWIAETLRKLSAVRAGRYIIHGSHETDIARSNEIGILIDAGLAFGTGHHGTTAGCLDMLTGLAKRRQFKNILDLGTGSGVLAIAAAKTFNASVLASDIDPVSTVTARANTIINGCGNSVDCITAAGFNNRQFGERKPFDLVLANILAKPLQSLALDISKHTAKDGMLILSGLLPHQRAPIVATFQVHGFRFEHAHYRDGWMTLVMAKGRA